MNPGEEWRGLFDLGDREPIDKLPATPAKQPQRSDRRDRIATAAMQALIGTKPGYCAETVAKDAVAFADALIDRLDGD